MLDAQAVQGLMEAADGTVVANGDYPQPRVESRHGLLDHHFFEGVKLNRLKPMAGSASASVATPYSQTMIIGTHSP